MVVLVTGGLGFIGSHLCEKLAAKGIRVRCFDDLSRGKFENISNAKKDCAKIEVVKGDLLNIEETRNAVADANIIYHLGAVVGVKHYVEDPLKVIKVNVQGTHNLLEAARKEDVEKFVFASTSEVYGKNPKVPLNEDDDRILGSTSIDRWCYSTSKALDEHLCLAYNRKYGINTTILRYFNTYGPRQESSDYGGVVSIFIRRVLNNKPPLVHGDGKQTRAFAYIDDVTRGTVLAAESKSSDGEVFNIGNAEELSILELAQIVVQLFGQEERLKPILVPYESFYGISYEDIRRRVPDIHKAKKILGYEPKVNLRDGLKMTVDWYRSHLDRSRN